MKTFDNVTRFDLITINSSKFINVLIPKMYNMYSEIHCTKISEYNKTTNSIEEMLNMNGLIYE